MRGEKPPSTISKVRSITDGDILIDRMLDVSWAPPGAVTLTIRVTRSGTEEQIGYPSKGGQFLTPETETSTHQFFAFGLPAHTGEQGQKFVEIAAESTIYPFKEEDGPILETQQEYVGNRAFMSLQPKLLAEIDNAAARARNLMDKLIAEEKEEVSASQSA